jgi:hypothetical protein
VAAVVLLRKRAQAKEVAAVPSVRQETAKPPESSGPVIDI